MTAPSTAKYILKSALTGELPNSTYLTVGENLKISTSMIETVISPTLKLQNLAEFDQTGLLVNTSEGLSSVYIIGQNGINVANGSGINGSIDVTYQPDSTNQLIDVSLDGTNLTTIKKITFEAGQNIEISGQDDAFNNRSNIFIKNLALESELNTSIFANVQDGCAEVLSFESVYDEETLTTTLTAGYNFSQPILSGSPIQFLDVGDGELIWGEPISNLQSLTIVNETAPFKFVSDPTIITDEINGTLTMLVEAPTTPGTKVLAYDQDENVAKWYDYPTIPIESMTLNPLSLNLMDTIFEILCDETQPITTTGNYTLNALVQTDGNVIRFAENLMTNLMSTYSEPALTDGVFTIGANALNVLFSTNVGDIIDKNYRIGFNTAGVDEATGLKFNSTTGEVEFSPVENFNNVTSVDMTVISTSASVLSVIGSSPVTTTGNLTLQHDAVPFPTFATVNQYGQYPAYYGNGKMEWGKLASGPLLFIAQGVGVFPNTGTSPQWNVSVQVFSQVIAGLDISRVIAVANNGGFSPAVNAATASLGRLQCNLTYTADTLTVVVESNLSAQSTGDNNCGFYWMIYYYPNY